MQRIRIKTAPKLGDQVDYSFYDSRYRNTGMGGSAEDEVKTTMGPVPREEASIEVERGEVVVGDTNTDGFLELFTFTGKPHSKGGTPVDVPAGSFIYSNTRKLRIKDEELLKKVFGLNPKKGGYTPAEIAKMYQVNQYVADLKNPEADNITKRSANEMLKNNLQKLSTLALVQESMKGFPDGIPAIAEMAANALGVTPDMFQQPQGGGQMAQEQMSPEQMPMARRGGLTKYQNAGTARPKGSDLSFTPATRVYINNEPFVWQATRDNDGLGTGDTYVFKNPKTGFEFFIDSKEFNRVYNTSNTHSRLYGDRSLNYYIQDSPGTFNEGAGTYGGDWYSYNYGLDLGKDASGKRNALKKDNVFFIGDKMFKVVDPYMATTVKNESAFATANPYSTPYAALAPVNTGPTSYNTRALRAEELEPVYDDNGMIVSYKSKGVSKIIPDTELRNAMKSQKLSILDLGTQNQTQRQPQSQSASDISRASSNGAAVLYDPNANQQPAQQQQQQQPAQQQRTARPAAPARNTTPSRTLDLTDFEEGGAYLPSYDMVGMYGLTKFQNAGENDEVFVNEITDGNGRKVKRYKKGDLRIVRDAQTGAVIVMEDKKTGVKREYKSDGVRVYNSKGQLMDYEAPEVTGGYDAKTYQNKYAKDIESYEKIMQGPENEELRTALYQEYRQAISNSKLPQDKKQQMLNLSQNDVMNYLLQGNKDNLLIKSAYGDQADFTNAEAWDRLGNVYDDKGNLIKGGSKNKVYNAVAQRLGFTPMDEVGRIAFQAAYRASKEIARDPKYIKQFQSAGFEIDPQGKTDADSDELNVSYIDDFYGNNTSKETWMVKEGFTPETPKETPQPGMKRAYYCVESSDGQRAVQTVEYAEGSQPTAPTGTKVTPYNSIEEAQAGCQSYDKGFPPPGKRKEGPWWAQDIVNFGFESTRDIERFKPAKQQVDFVTPEWTTITNAASVANTQGTAAMMANMAQNSTDGNTAIASALGVSGEAMQNNALSDAQTNTVNAQTSTQAGQFNAQIENTERDLNAKYNRQYIVDLATEGQQNANAENLQDRNTKKALIAGMTNWGDKKYMETLYPQVYINPINFDVEFSGEGRSVMGPETYMPSYGGATARGVGRRSGSSAYATAAAVNSDAGVKAYKETYEKYRAELGEDAAKQAALGEMNRVNALLRSNPQAAMYTSTDGDDGLRYGGFIQYGTGGAIVTPEEMFRILIKRKTGR